MTEWGVVLVLVTLLGFITGIITPLIKLNTAIVRLTDAVETLHKDMESMSESNSKTHGRIFELLDEHDNKLDDHEKQLIVIKEIMKER